MTRHEPVARYLLVGTESSLAQMRLLLNSVQPPPRIAGELLSHGAGRLTETVRQTGATMVLLSLPLVMQKQIGQLTSALDRAGMGWRYLPTLADQLAGRTAPLAGGAKPQAWTGSGVAGGISGGIAGIAGIAGFPGVAGIPGIPGGDEVEVSQLIDRVPRPLDEQAIHACLADQVVLITGAGGSIGSELARCVCRFQPRKLVLVERSENALFEVSRQLERIFPRIERVAELHDVTQPAATAALVERHGPKVIFHAAAHKHVPMMEDHPAQAVENNFLGTRSIADAMAQTPACAGGRFVMISTDKAVNPTSVMGATKRMAELYIQHLSRTSDVIFSMVRFGNVLGSACSVLPIWTDQLRNGGPITVTHPRMTRYFMTIPEAAGLVLQAATFSSGGEVFLLDMGQPINILELAHRFIRLHGLEVSRDVAIQITGPRPGEKLFEELAYTSEDMLPTPHPSIRRWRTAPPDPAAMRQMIQTFERLRCATSTPTPALAPGSISGLSGIAASGVTTSGVGISGGGGHPWQHASREAIVNALRGAVPEMLHALAG